MCLFCKLKNKTGDLIFKFKSWLFFRKVRKDDIKNSVKFQKWLDNNPRSSFSFVYEIKRDYFTNSLPFEV